MRGVLKHTGGKWIISYFDTTVGLVNLDVQPGRIDDLNMVGVHLKNETEVDFQIREIESFPYRYAVPYVPTETENTETIVKKVRTKNQIRIELFFSGFDEITEKTIVCDGYDNNSAGYWYFYVRDDNNNRSYVFASPISKTIFNSIEEIETEY